MLSSHPLTPPRKGPPPRTPKVFTVARFFAGQVPALLLPSTWSWQFRVKPIGKPVAVIAPGKSPRAVGVYRRLDASTLPPEFEALRSAYVELMTAAGTRTCTAQIADFYHAEAFGGERAVYTSALDQEKWGALVRDGKLEELGAELWRRAQYSPAPMASVSHSDGDCGDAMWGRLRSESPVRTGVSVQNAALAKLVAEQIWKHGAYDDYRAKYELEEPTETAEEWDEELEQSIEVSPYGVAKGTPTLALLQTKIGDVLYSITGDGKLADERDVHVCAEVLGAVDADGDGELDLLSTTSFGTGCLALSNSPNIHF